MLVVTTESQNLWGWEDPWGSSCSPPLPGNILQCFARSSEDTNLFFLSFPSWLALVKCFQLFVYSISTVDLSFMSSLFKNNFVCNEK